MSAPSRRSSLDSSAQTWLLLGLAAGAAAIAGSIVVALRLGYGLAGMPLPAGNWGAVLRGLLSGTVAWPLQSWIVLASLLVVLAAVATVIVRLVRRGGHQRIDRAARYMGQGREILDVTRRGAAAKAARLGIEGSPGVLVGRTVAGGMDLMTSWEDVGVCIAGPRTGKTTSQVIPAIADAPGAVVTTSNKRDVVDATRALRAKVGQVWVFDPQGIVDEPAT